MEEAWELTALAGRLLLGFIFLRAGVTKLLGTADFSRAVAGYELLPKALIAPVATWLPRIELAAALALLAGILTVVAAAGVAVLLALFAVAVAINLLRGRTIDCGCESSTAPEQIGWGLVARDAGLVCLALFVALETPVALSVDAVWKEGGAVSTSDAVAVLLATSVIFLGLTIAKEARRLRQQVLRFSSLSESVP